jgi:hypothetical protein
MLLQHQDERNHNAQIYPLCFLTDQYLHDGTPNPTIVLIADYKKLSNDMGCQQILVLDA